MKICFLDPSKLERVRAGINTDPEFKLAAKYISTDVLLGVDDSECIFKVREGVITEIKLDLTPLDAWHFSIRGSAESWGKFLQLPPPPSHNSLFGTMLRKTLRVEGDLEKAFAYFWAVSRMLDVMRQLQNNK